MEGTWGMGPRAPFLWAWLTGFTRTISLAPKVAL